MLRAKKCHLPSSPSVVVVGVVILTLCRCLPKIFVASVVEGSSSYSISSSTFSAASRLNSRWRFGAIFYLLCFIYGNLPTLIIHLIEILVENNFEIFHPFFSLLALMFWVNKFQIYFQRFFHFTKTHICSFMITVLNRIH